jgi:thioredoxin 1
MKTLSEIETIISNNPAVMLYFSAPTCNVCHALKPKLFEAVEQNFEQFEIISIDISETPEIASHFSVFAIPTLVVFLDGREFLRKSRHMSVGEVIEAIRRPYEIMMR